MRADNIASHGRVGKVSAMSISSFGRLYRKTAEVIAGIVREVFRGVSAITNAILKISKVDLTD